MNNKKIFNFLLIITLFISGSIYSQSSRWKRTRYEIVGGVGVTGFMGDLGGGSETSHFISDFDFASQRFVVQGGMRYKILEPLAAKATLSYGMLSGSDSKAEDVYRQNRNLSFRSTLIELGTQLEFSIIKEPASTRFSRRRRRFSLKNLMINTYIFGGVSAFYFNPKGKDDGEGGTDKWVALQPLGTEGQGLMEGRDKYSRLSIAFPMGIGFKYNLNRKYSIGAEFGARYTITDYIDDVSTTYVDNDWLASKDPQAARMADKSDPLKVINNAGGQRGEAKYNDYYIFSMVTISYKLRTGRNGLPKF